jgi:hypothetical protein
MSQQRIIRDGVLERVKAFEQFTTFKFSADPSHQVQPYEVPYIGVYLMPEEVNYDGAWNLTEPHFTNDADIGISVILANNDGAELDDNLDNAYDLITDGLLTDPTLMGFETIYKIEGVKKISRQHLFGVTGSTNEMPIGELRMTWRFTFRSYYPPVIRDDLKLIVIKTLYPTVEDAPATQQVTMPVNIEFE